MIQLNMSVFNLWTLISVIGCSTVCLEAEYMFSLVPLIPGTVWCMKSRDVTRHLAETAVKNRACVKTDRVCLAMPVNGLMDATCLDSDDIDCSRKDSSLFYLLEFMHGMVTGLSLHHKHTRYKTDPRH